MNAVVRKIRRIPREVEEYLGPAEVTAVFAHEVVVSLPDGGVTRVKLAFSMPYTPAFGDILLIIGKDSAHYAIGVIRGSGRTDLSFQGNVQLRSVDGKLSLEGDRGVEIRGPELDVYTGALRMIARNVVQTFESVCQHVTALLRVHAGESQTLVDGGAYTHAKTAAILTKETVIVNGREIHLG
jgi:Protein of unknown function (DUF3540)